MKNIQKQSNLNPEFEQMTLYTTALCNLKCSYCYICKDEKGGLKKMDEDLEEDFKNKAQIKQTLDFDPNIKNTLKSLSLWGGEPFIGVYRLIDHMDDYFEAFPNLDTIDVSTNLTLPDHYQRIQDLINAVEARYDDTKQQKPFSFMIQISIDGYPEMNDNSRGYKTTEKILKNWKEICEKLYFNPIKSRISFFTKPTFSKDNFKYVNTPDKAYKWLEFFNNEMFLPYKKSPLARKENVDYHSSLWNCAAPTEWTSEDGKEYAKVSKAFSDVYERGSKLEEWSYEKTYVAEAARSISSLRDCNNNFKNLIDSFKCEQCGNGCGVFSYSIVPLHGGIFTMCHRGFFDAYVDYANNLSNLDNLNGLAQVWNNSDSNDWIFDKEKYAMMHKTFKKLYQYPSYIWYTDMMQQIKEYADAGIIKEKYKDLKQIEPCLGNWLLNSQCIQDAYLLSGSWVTRSPLEIPLMFNGTMDVVLYEIQQVIKNKRG